MDLPWSATELLLAFVTTTVASAVQGSVGFGLNLLAAPILALIDPAFVPGPALAAGIVQPIIMGWRERASVELGHIGWAAIGRVAGTATGVVVLTLASATQANVTFGVLVLLGVVLSILGLNLSPTPRALIGAGCASGVMGTISSIGGPPIALLYQHERGNKLRGTLAGHFMIGSAIALAGLTAAGHFGLHDAIAASVLVPGILLGFPLATPLARIIDRRSARPAILALAALAALLVIVREFV